MINMARATKSLGQGKAKKEKGHLHREHRSKKGRRKIHGKDGKLAKIAYLRRKEELNECEIMQEALKWIL